MTVGIRRAVFRLLLLGAGAFVLVVLWQARAAGAQEIPSIESPLAASPSGPELDVSGAPVPTPAPSPPPVPIPAPGGDVAALTGPVEGGLDRLAGLPSPPPPPPPTPVPPPPSPPANGTPAFAALVLAEAAPPSVDKSLTPAGVGDGRSAEPAPVRDPAPGDDGPERGPGGGPARSTTPRPLPTDGVAVVVLAFVGTLVLRSRPRDATAWLPGIPALRPLSRPG